MVIVNNGSMSVNNGSMSFIIRKGAFEIFDYHTSRKFKIIGKTEVETNSPQGRSHCKIFLVQFFSLGYPVGAIIDLIK